MLESQWLEMRVMQGCQPPNHPVEQAGQKEGATGAGGSANLTTAYPHPCRILLVFAL